MSTSYYRDRDGHKANTVYDLGNQRELQISTRRWSDGNLVTTATVHRIDGNARVHMLGFGGDGDFNHRIVFTRPSRVTANVVRFQHDQCLTKLQEIIQAANQHYENLKAKGIVHAC